MVARKERKDRWHKNKRQMRWIKYSPNFVDWSFLLNEKWASLTDWAFSLLSYGNFFSWSDDICRNENLIESVVLCSLLDKEEKFFLSLNWHLMMEYLLVEWWRRSWAVFAWEFLKWSPSCPLFCAKLDKNQHKLQF